MALDGGPPLFDRVRAFGVSADSELSAWLHERGVRSAGALECLAREAIGACDVVLWRGRSAEALKQLSALDAEPPRTPVRVLVVLADATAQGVAACLDAGAFHCCGEPVALDLLEALIGSSLAHAAAREAAGTLWPPERHALEARIEGALDHALDAHFFDDSIAIAVAALGAKIGHFGGLDANGNLEVSSFCALEGSLPPRPEARRLREPNTLLDRVLLTRETAIANAPHWFCRQEIELKRSVVTPILYGGTFMGFLHVAERNTDFTLHDARRLEAIAQRLSSSLAARTHAAVAAKRTAELVRVNARNQEEQEVARELVGRMLREGCLDAPGIRYLMTAKDLFNGDLALAAELPSGGLRIMLGDFVGHGLPAAIGGLPLASVFYATTKKGVPIVDVVRTMNEALMGTLPRGFFCSAIVVEIEGDRLRCWNGGMPPGLVRRHDSATVEELTSGDFPLGVVASSELWLGIETAQFRPLDRLFCFSDGLIEASAPSGELYGLERTIQVLGTSPIERAFDNLILALTDFRGSATRTDDLSLLEVSAYFPRLQMGHTRTAT